MIYALLCTRKWNDFCSIMYSIMYAIYFPCHFAVKCNCLTFLWLFKLCHWIMILMDYGGELFDFSRWFVSVVLLVKLNCTYFSLTNTISPTSGQKEQGKEKRQRKWSICGLEWKLVFSLSGRLWSLSYLSITSGTLTTSTFLYN